MTGDSKERSSEGFGPGIPLFQRRNGNEDDLRLISVRNTFLRHAGKNFKLCISGTDPGSCRAGWADPYIHTFDPSFLPMFHRLNQGVMRGVKGTPR
jgi:hypothetical protein